jgi:hypothetical protein
MSHENERASRERSCSSVLDVDESVVQGRHVEGLIEKSLGKGQPHHARLRCWRRESRSRPMQGGSLIVPLRRKGQLCGVWIRRGVVSGD